MSKLDGLLTGLGLLKGDVDGNKKVEFADFLVLSSNFGKNAEYTQGDFDKNGKVEFADFLVLSSNFGKAAAASVASAGVAANVPEPTGALLVTCSLLGLLAVRRGRQGETTVC